MPYPRISDAILSVRIPDASLRFAQDVVDFYPVQPLPQVNVQTNAQVFTYRYALGSEKSRLFLRPMFPVYDAYAPLAIYDPLPGDFNKMGIILPILEGI
jgi:hypothetical protein